MEIHKPTITIRRWAFCLVTACLIGPMLIHERSTAQALAEQEFSRRSTAIQEAQELLRKGDEAYQAGRYGEAVEAYAGAREMIPDAPVSTELRSATTQRYAQASVEQARLLSQQGDIAAAKAAVDQVLRENVAPNDPGALAMRAQLDDPIHTNPALTAEHSKNVNQVRRLLYTAEGAFNLGKFDEANTHYKDVLRIDPTNTAAKRGMEQVASAKTDYQKAAVDHTRAEMLAQVDAAWETQLRPPNLGKGPEDPGGPPAPFRVMTLAAKLDRIIIPKIALDQATLEEAIDFLRMASRKVDLDGTDSESLNFNINLGPSDSETATRIRKQKLDLKLSQVPLTEVLKHITKLTHTSFRTDDYSVIITPAGTTSDELISRSYRVPPDFLTSLSSGTTASDAKADPFAEKSGNTGLLTNRISAQEALVRQGVAFPDGASASYSSANNTLSVINTPSNQDTISQIVETLGQTEAVTISVRVTMIKTQKSNLDELSFDWLMSPFKLNGDSNLFASGGTVGSTHGRTAADFSPTVALPATPDATVNQGVVTNGLRSGDLASNENTIDNLIANPLRQTQKPSVAPGVLSLTGQFTDGQVQMLMRGLNQKKSVDVMARPSVLTRSGQAASVVISREFIYPSEYEPPQLPSQANSTQGQSPPVTPASPTAFKTKQLGISLEVLPVADAQKRYIDVTLNPSITEFDGFVNFGSPITSAVQNPLGGTSQVTLTENTILMPIFSVQKTSTQLTVADGATIVIAGLMADGVQRVNDKVPILGDLPLVGRLFQSVASKPVSTAVIFLVHVELIDPTGRPYRDR